MTGDDPQRAERQQENEGGDFGEAALRPSMAPVIDQDAEVSGPNRPTCRQLEPTRTGFHEIGAGDADGEQSKSDVQQPDQSAPEVAQRGQIEDQAVGVAALELAVLKKK